jgi:2-oxo-4-hydroxy-4-carboxy-5-ureidoimidazoline decarboxylase
MARADAVWCSLGRADWLDAFAAHPPIGSDAGARDPGSHAWAAHEQSHVTAATAAVRDRLADGNRAYLARFGYIFIVCATGKSADTMLRLLEQRLAHDPEVELRVAADEQRRITQLRLAKLLDLAA